MTGGRRARTSVRHGAEGGVSLLYRAFQGTGTARLQMVSGAEGRITSAAGEKRGGTSRRTWWSGWEIGVEAGKNVEIEPLYPLLNVAFFELTGYGFRT